MKTSIWVKTPADIRQLGGALFGDRRFGHVFIYHNGAQSYYGAKAFRGVLRVSKRDRPHEKTATRERVAVEKIQIEPLVLLRAP